MHLRGPQAGRESVCAEPTSIGELRSPGWDQGTSGIAPARKGAVVPGSVALIQAVSGLSQDLQVEWKLTLWSRSCLLREP